MKCLTIDAALFKSTVLVLAEVYMDGKHMSENVLSPIGKSPCFTYQMAIWSPEDGVI